MRVCALLACVAGLTFAPSDGLLYNLTAFALQALRKSKN
jgi:hypothetical protein